MQMAINSLSLNLSTDKVNSQTIILPSSKFNKFIKLIQVERREIKPQTPPRTPLLFNEHWKYHDHDHPAVFDRRAKKRVKTEPCDQEEKWTIMRKRV
jgi:hypothetical protein